MKKISTRDQLLLFLVAIAGGIYVFYSYVYLPFETKIKEAKEQRETLVIEVQDTDLLEKKAKQLKEELTLHEEEKKQFELERMITREQQEQLLLYIGDKANELGINLVKFEEKKTELNSTYNVVGYDIKASGDSKDLILFMNKLYSFYNYCFITDLNLRKVEIYPTFDTKEMDSLSEEEKLKIAWDDEQINLILFDIPPYITDEESSEGNESDETHPPKTELQLDFSLYFILSD